MSTTAAESQRATTPLRLAVIVGSVRKGRMGSVVAAWVAEQARQFGSFQVDLVDLADLPLPAALSAEPDEATAGVLAELSPRLAAADAFLVVTPEYNHSFPASLKSLIDWHKEEWHVKPVAFASYGGISGGLRAVEQLRQVFPEVHAMTVRDALCFPNVWERFDEDGQPRDAETAATAAKRMFAQLEWWAEALREARRRQPYPA